VDEKDTRIKDLCDLNYGLVQEVIELRSIEGDLKDCVSELETFALKKYLIKKSYLMLWKRRLNAFLRSVLMMMFLKMVMMG
jgi:hypothetical protein